MTTLSDRRLLAFMLAASVASTIGGLPFNSLPVMLGSLADSFNLPPAAVGLIGSVCFGGYLLGTLRGPDLDEPTQLARAHRGKCSRYCGFVCCQQPGT